MRTAFADGDDAITGGWDQERYDEVFTEIAARLDPLGITTIGSGALELTAREETKQRHPSSRHILPGGVLPRPQIIPHSNHTPGQDADIIYLPNRSN